MEFDKTKGAVNKIVTKIIPNSARVTFLSVKKLAMRSNFQSYLLQIYRSSLLLPLYAFTYIFVVNVVNCPRW